MRTLGAALATVLLGLASVASCAQGEPVPQGLVTRLEPGLLEAAASWDWQTAPSSLRWEEDGRLGIECRSSQGPYTFVKQVWVDFSRPAAPAVYVREWSAEGATRWYFTDIHGSARVSSGGRGLGRVNGPGLALDYELVGDHSGSPNPASGRFLLTNKQLLRE